MGGTHELLLEKNSMKLILDNIDQGLLTVDIKGDIVGQGSHMASQIFGEDYKSKKAHELLGQEASVFQEGLNIIFEEALPFDSCLPLLPSKTISGGMSIKLLYKPVCNAEKKITALLVMASDITEIEKLHIENKEAEEKNRALIKVLGSKNDFIECIEIAKNLTSGTVTFKGLKRNLHTLKGCLAFLDCRWLAEICHKWENEIEETQIPINEFAQTVQDDISSRLKKFMDENNQILKMNPDAQMIELELNRISGVMSKVRQSNPGLKTIQELDELFKVSLAEELGWLSDAFIQSAEKLGKQVKAIDFVSEVKIPTRVYKVLFKSFIHIVRNAADHGIEDSDSRLMLGKPELGSMRVELKENHSHYELVFKDDGAGVDVEKLRNKLKVHSLDHEKTDEEILNYIFSSGISTQDTLSETSGRGVGLDAVKYEAEALGGTCVAHNYPGEGLEIRLTFKKISFSEHEQAA